MHVSLDSALGRQRRLNSVGESVFQIAPSAAAAYSLRSLTGGDPKVVRVRRDTGGGAGDNDEEDFTVSGILSGALVDFVGSGNDGFVDTWYDQSGNGNDVEQATASRQPKIVNSGSLVTDANGHPELDFASDFLSKTAFTQGDLEQPNNTFTVAKLNTNDDSNRKLYDGTVGAKRNMLFLGTVGSGQFGLYSQVIIYTGETATNDKHLFSGLHNGASSELFINSVSKASGNTGAYSMSGINIAKNHTGETNFWGGQIQELIIYNSNQSSNRVAIENNINNHYSIF